MEFFSASRNASTVELGGETMAKRSERIWRRFERLGLVDWYRMEDVSSWCDRIDGEAVKRAIESGKLDGIAVILPYTVSGDYVGSRVETSNCRALLEAYPETVWERREMYSSSMAMVWLRDMVDVLSEAHEHHGLLDDLEELQRYPVLDESALCELEMEDMQENWDSWAQSDLMREIGNITIEEDSDLDWRDLQPIELGQLESASWDFGHAEGCGWWWDIERLAKHVVDERPELVRWVTQQQRGA